MTTRTIFSLGALAGLTFFSAKGDLRSQSRDVVAVITELKLKQGDVQIRLPGKSNAERPDVLSVARSRHPSHGFQGCRSGGSFYRRVKDRHGQRNQFSF